jgi:LacI family transcriptional regulator
LDPARAGRVADATAARVARSAAELGYVPDRIARSLRTRRSGMVGVVVPDLANPVVGPIVRGIESVLWGAGLACVLVDTDNDAGREADAVAGQRDRGCDGLILASVTRHSPVPVALMAAGVPAVLVTRGTDEPTLPLVSSDDATGVTALVGHLAALGHRRIAYLAGPPDVSTTVTRLGAFRAACERAGLDPGELPVRSCAAYTVAAAEPVAADLLSSQPEITAVVAGNDMIAVGCLAAMERMSLRCPEDLSLVGFNDMPLVGRLKPGLTTVSIPQREIGAAAASLLLDRLAGRSFTTAAVLLPTSLVVRASTSAPRPGALAP